MKERWDETTAIRSNESSRLYLYAFFVKGYSVGRCELSTRAASRCRMARAIAGEPNGHREAFGDNVQLLITLDLAALV